MLHFTSSKFFLKKCRSDEQKENKIILSNIFICIFRKIHLLQLFGIFSYIFFYKSDMVPCKEF